MKKALVMVMTSTLFTSTNILALPSESVAEDMLDGLGKLPGFNNRPFKQILKRQGLSRPISRAERIRDEILVQASLSLGTMLKIFPILLKYVNILTKDDPTQVFRILSESDLETLLFTLTGDELAQLFSILPEDVQQRIVNILPDNALARLINTLPIDNVLQLFKILREDTVSRLVNILPEEVLSRILSEG